VGAGGSISVSEAMQAMAIKSANDAAVAMAEKLGGSESRFAAMMTLRAQELGMANTHFANASGLPDSRQITTARDIAILSRAVMRDYPQYYSLFSQKQMVFRGVAMNNHNKLLFRLDGVDGLKTGYTNASGYNLAVTAVRDGRRLIAVVLGGSTGAVRDNNAQDLLLTGFDIQARRGRGENIQVAQNLFEPEPRSLASRPSVEQGDQDGGDIVLSSATPAPRLSKTKISESTRAAREDAKKDEEKKEAKASKKGRWSVQVGAFKTKSDAREQIALVTKRFSKHFVKANGEADKSGSGYRARFSGYTEASAKSACSALKSKKMACMVIAPG
jgi:D-alanyl-D-alanine carboxypeptidase (penicillin-binding protein 5/6)